MTTIIRATLGGIVAEVVEACDDLVLRTTATAGAASTITFGNAPLKAAAALDDVFNNRFLYVIAGVSAGDERFVDDYAGATRVATMATAFTATPTTTSEIILTEKRPGLRYERAVKTAIRRAATVFPRPLTDASLRAGNILHNGAFQFWDDLVGVSVVSGAFIYTRKGASDGWSVQGTSALARKQTPGTTPGLYPYAPFGAALDSSGTNAAYLQWEVPDWYRFTGKVMTFKGVAY